jgi:hypothetical protein
MLYGPTGSEAGISVTAKSPITGGTLLGYIFTAIAHQSRTYAHAYMSIYYIDCLLELIAIVKSNRICCGNKFYPKIFNNHR